MDLFVRLWSHTILHNHYKASLERRERRKIVDRKREARVSEKEKRIGIKGEGVN